MTLTAVIRGDVGSSEGLTLNKTVLHTLLKVNFSAHELSAKRANHANKERRQEVLSLTAGKLFPLAFSWEAHVILEQCKGIPCN